MTIIQLDRLIRALENEGRQDNDKLLKFYYRKRIELKTRIIKSVLSKI